MFQFVYKETIKKSILGIIAAFVFLLSIDIDYWTPIMIVCLEKVVKRLKFLQIKGALLVLNTRTKGVHSILQLHPEKWCQTLNSKFLISWYRKKLLIVIATICFKQKYSHLRSVYNQQSRTSLVCRYLVHRKLKSSD